MRVTIWISVAYAFAQREYAFEGISEEDIDSSTLSGAIHSVHNHSLRKFIEQFPYLGKRELGSIAIEHGIQFRTRLVAIAMRMDALRGHACVPDRVQVLYKFSALDRPRKVIFVPPTPDDPRDPLEEKMELRVK